MKSKESIQELILVLLASIILSLSFSFNNQPLLLLTFLYFIIILGINILIKKMVGFYLEINVKIKPWSWYQYGLRKDAHFKAPLPMFWLPLLLSLMTRGYLKWLAILSFEVEAKAERVSRRHGEYRFTQVTEWHIAWIALWGIIVNVIFGIIGYLAGFELFARLSIFYAAWSLVPLSSLDGSKIFFANRHLWATFAIILTALTLWTLIII